MLGDNVGDSVSDGSGRVVAVVMEVLSIMMVLTVVLKAVMMVLSEAALWLVTALTAVTVLMVVKTLVGVCAQCHSSIAVVTATGDSGVIMVSLLML